MSLAATVGMTLLNLRLRASQGAGNVDTKYTGITAKEL